MYGVQEDGTPMNERNICSKRPNIWVPGERAPNILLLDVIATGSRPARLPGIEIPGYTNEVLRTVRERRTGHERGSEPRMLEASGLRLLPGGVEGVAGVVLLLLRDVAPDGGNVVVTQGERAVPGLPAELRALGEPVGHEVRGRALDVLDQLRDVHRGVEAHEEVDVILDA